MPLLTAPDLPLHRFSTLIFLAGSIEQGRAESWQTGVAEQLLANHPHLTVANPRRQAWDSSWLQTPEHPAFAEQVNWELEHLLKADQVLFVFDGNTQSPVTLLELGLMLGQHPERVTIVCPTHFWRYGNVAITASRFGVPVLSSIGEGVQQVLSRL